MKTILRLKVLLIFGLFAHSSFAAVSFPDAASFYEVNSTSVNPNVTNLSHTVTSGTTLLTCITARLASESTASVTWNSVGMALITTLDVSTNASDAGVDVWGLVSPTAATADFAVTSASGNWQLTHSKTCLNVHGTETSSVAAAIQNLSIDENTTATNTNVHASGGSAGNKLLFIGMGIGQDMVPASNDASFTELEELATAGSTGDNHDHSIYIAEKNAASAITVTWGATDENIGGLFEVVVAGAGISFSSGPTIAATTNGYTISGTVTGDDATIYAAALNPGGSPPADCDAVQALFGSAEIFASEAWTEDGGDSFDLTESGAMPDHDIYICADSGASQTSVTSSADERRSADAGQTITELTSVATTSPYYLASDNTGDTTSGSAVVAGMSDTSFLQIGDLVDLSAGFADITDIIVLDLTSSSISLENNSNSTESNITVTKDTYYSPTVAAGDVVEGDDATNEGSFAITWAADGDLSYTDPTASCQTIDYNIQDTSDGTGDFDAGPPAWATGDDVFYVNCPVPEFDENVNDEPSLLTLILDEDEAMTSIDFTDYCIDANGQTLAFADRGGNLPPGLSLSGPGVLSGTPTTEDEAGTAQYLSCVNQGVLYAVANFTSYVINTWTMPDCTGDTIAACLSAVDSVAPWYNGVSISASGSCSDTVAVNDIISTTPAASEVDDPLQAISAVVSTGDCGGHNLGEGQLRQDLRLKVE